MVAPVRSHLPIPNVREGHTMKMALLATSIALFLCGTAGVVIYQEHQYQQTTSPDVKEAHLKLAKDLNKLPPGTFLRQKDSSLLLLLSSDRDSDDKYVTICPYSGASSHNMATKDLARNNERVILPTYLEEWNEAAREFLIPSLLRETTLEKK